MQSARLQQEIDPADVGIGTGYGERGSGGMSQDIFARIGLWLYELSRGSPSGIKTTVRPSTMRTSLGRGLLRIFVAVVLAVGIAGGALAWQWPRSETVRQLVAQWAPQSVLDRLPSVDQDTPADAASSDLRPTMMGPGGSYQATADNADANANLSPMEQQQLIQKLVRDVENLQQGMDQLRAGQDQLLRMMLRAPAQNAQARAPVPRPTTTGLAPGSSVLAPTLPPQPRRPAVVLPPPRY
jgi:hypothetical protein